MFSTERQKIEWQKVLEQMKDLPINKQMLFGSLVGW
jgi:hypothetical protein